MKLWLAKMMNEPILKIDGVGDIPVILPEGCVGIMHVFKTKKAARAWYGEKVELCEIEIKKEA
jgi:hypothetical protein